MGLDWTRKVFLGVGMLGIALSLPVQAAPTVCVASADSAGLHAALSNWANYPSGGTYEIRLESGNYSLPAGFDTTQADGSAFAPNADLVLLGGYQPTANHTCADATLTRSIIDGEDASAAYIFLLASHVTVANLELRRFDRVPGIRVAGYVGLDVERNIFDGNSNIQFYNGSGTAHVIRDNLFFDNAQGSGQGAVEIRFLNTGFSYSSNVYFENNTVADSLGIGVAMLAGGASGATTNIYASNDIVWGSSTTDITGSGLPQPLVQFSDFGSSNGSGAVSFGQGNISVNPLFINAATDNFRLRATLPTVSPAVNAGALQTQSHLSGAYSAIDLDGHARVVGTHIDMGTYESAFNDQSELSVTNTNVSGPGSLAQAILNARSMSGAAHINFGIPGSCPQVISLTSSLPDLSGELSIDATTQPGWVANSEGGQYNGTWCVIISAGLPYAFHTTDANSRLTIQGIAFLGFSEAAIKLEAGVGHQISGNYILTDPPVANGNGIEIFGSAQNTTIGGPDFSFMNVIAGMGGNGIAIDASPGGNQIANNLIGLSTAGLAIPQASNGADGIDIVNSPDNTITSNTIGNNGQAGIELSGSMSTGNVIQGNTIGADDYSDVSAPNQKAGVLVDLNASQNTIGESLFALSFGGTTTFLTDGAGNSINANAGPGIWISANGSEKNVAIGNQLGGNGGPSADNGMDIDLGLIGPLANTTDNTGPNEQQPYAVINHSYWIGGESSTAQEVVQGVLQAQPDTNYYVEFYGSTRVSGYRGRGVADYPIGREQVVTDAGGLASFQYRGEAVSSTYISAVATGLSSGTSENGNASGVVTDAIFVDDLEQ